MFLALSAADKTMRSKLRSLIKAARDDKETAYFCLCEGFHQWNTCKSLSLTHQYALYTEHDLFSFSLLLRSQMINYIIIMIKLRYSLNTNHYITVYKSSPNKL